MAPVPKNNLKFSALFLGSNFDRLDVASSAFNLCFQLLETRI